MTKPFFRPLTRTVVAAAVLALAGGAQAETVLKLSHQFPGGKGDVRDEMVQMMARDVAAANVDLVIKVFPGSSLVKPQEQWKAMLTGQIDMASFPLDYASGFHPQFGATLMPGLPWEIRPLEPAIELHPGELRTTRFLVRNLSDQTIVGQAVPSVSPTVAARHFRKLDCFCFTQQTLAPGESREMALTFIVDGDIGEEISEPYTPPFEMVKVPPCISSMVSLPSRPFLPSSAISFSISAKLI